MSSLVLDTTNVAMRNKVDVRCNFHRYLLEDVSSLFGQYMTKELDSEDIVEIHYRAGFLRTRYDRVNPGVFGLKVSTCDNRLGVYIFPV